MTRGEQMRRDALRRYFVFRLKLIELFHFHLLWCALADDTFSPENVMEHGGREFADSVRTAYLSWYCTIVDRTQGGLNIFTVWWELFPNHRDEIERVRAKVEPEWEVLRNFRDKCGFHADTPRNYFLAKQKLLENPQAAKAVQDFLDLAKLLINLTLERCICAELGAHPRSSFRAVAQLLPNCRPTGSNPSAGNRLGRR